MGIPALAAPGAWGQLWGRAAETSATLTGEFWFLQGQSLAPLTLPGSPTGHWTAGGVGGEGVKGDLPELENLEL